MKARNPFFNEPAHKKFQSIHDLILGDHLCFIYQTDEEHKQVLTSYIEDGFSSNHQVLYITDLNNDNGTKHNFLGRDISKDLFPNENQFLIKSYKETYSLDGFFEPEKMIDLLQDQTDQALKQGFNGLRITGEMSWIFHDLIPKEKLVGYEAMLNLFFQDNPAMALCQYDKRLFNATFLLEIIKTHPYVVLGTQVYENYYYLPPKIFFDDNPSEGIYEIWTQNLEKQRKPAQDIIDILQQEQQIVDEDKNKNWYMPSIIKPIEQLNTNDVKSIINTENLQLLMNYFYKLTHIGIGILDLKGNILVATGWQDICTKFHRVNPESEKNCIESDTFLSQKVKEGEHIMYKCKNNLWDIITPIYVGDRHVANLFLGQFFFEDEVPNISVFEKQAEKYGFDKQKYINALQRVPRFTRETIDNVMAFYKLFAKIVSNLSYSNIQLTRSLLKEKSILEALKESEEKFRLLVENIEYVFWMSSPGIKEMLYISPSYEKIWGRSCDSLYSNPTSFTESIHPDDKNRIIEAIKQHAKGKWNHEYRIVLPNGTIRWINDTGFPIFDSNNQLKMMIGIARDITKNKIAEELLKLSLDKARKADQLKSAFLANVSHEIRTPLNAIMGFAELMITDNEFDESYKENLRYIKTSSKNLMNLINDILEISKIEAGEVDIHSIPFNLHEEINTIWVTSQIHLESKKNKIQFDLVIDEAVEEKIMGDPIRVNEVLSNLLSNAIKFTNKGKINLIVNKTDNNLLQFIVKDTGIGVATDKLQTIFNPFEQEDNSISKHYGGTGLGLSISKKLVELMGGQITVESTKGVGSTFSFAIPYLPVHQSQNHSKTTNQDLKIKTKGKILIAEDDEMNIIYLQNFMELHGLNIHLVKNGKQAIKVFQKDLDIRLILMDIRMPVMDGYQAIKKIKSIVKKENRPYTPIIAITALAMPEDIELGKKSGFDEYITKPFHYEYLLRIITKYL